MRNLKLTLIYKGTRYAGWQKQKNQPTVQGILENRLEKLLGEKINSVVAGRTDSGVHGLSQTVNFTTHSVKKLSLIKTALNPLLPNDIAVQKIEEVPLSFNARYSVKSKVYRYTIWNSTLKPVFDSELVYHYAGPLKISRMRKAAKFLLGKNDFSFFASQARYSNASCTVKKVLVKKEGEKIKFIISADRFLRHMVRRMVGTLLNVGRGKYSPEAVRDILQKKLPAGPTLPAHGLCLLKVNY